MTPEALLDLLFPPKCPFCGRVLDGVGVCPGCEAALPWSGEAVRTLAPELRCAAPLLYQGPVRRALLQFKFGGAVGMAAPLGGLIAQCAAEELAGEFDVVAWVPVSRPRLRARGYDQAELLARAACKRWNTKPERLADKIVDNPAQSGQKDAAARWRNVQDIYALPRPEAVRGRRILLVDDICTTGATLCACARALREGGAASVVCAAAAFAALENEEENLEIGQ